MARLGRGRREGARISHNRSVATPTPLVRKRLTQTPVASDRAAIVARFFRRKRAHILLRAPLPFFARRQPQPVVSRADVRASSRVRFFQPRGAKIIRAASTPTATPLIRKRVVVETTIVSRSRVAARLRRRKPLMLRAPMPQPAPFSRPNITVITRRRRPAVVRAHVHHHAIVLRAALPAPVTLVRPAITVVRRRRAVTVRAFYGRQGARIMRAPVMATPTVRVKTALVVRSRRAPLVAHARRNPVFLRALSTQTPTPLVRKRVTLETQTGNRPRVVARVRHHSRAYLLRSTGGSAAPVVTTSAVFFGPPTPGEVRLTGQAAANQFGGTPPDGELAGTVAAASFGPSSPRRN